MNGDLFVGPDIILQYIHICRPHLVLPIQSSEKKAYSPSALLYRSLIYHEPDRRIDVFNSSKPM